MELINVLLIFLNNVPLFLFFHTSLFFHSPLTTRTPFRKATWCPVCFWYLCCPSPDMSVNTGFGTKPSSITRIATLSRVTHSMKTGSDLISFIVSQMITTELTGSWIFRRSGAAVCWGLFHWFYSEVFAYLCGKAITDFCMPGYGGTFVLAGIPPP